MNMKLLDLPISNKMAICVMCVNVNDITIDFYKTIKTHDIYVLIDNNKVIVPDIENITFIQISEDECSGEGYDNSNFLVGKHPSAWDKAFYYFGKLCKKYKNVWLVEEDVFIPTKNTIQSIDLSYSDSDLLVSQNEKNSTGNIDQWFWSKARVKDKFVIPWYKSMVCACRISRRLFECINSHKDSFGELCFIEFMINTVAMQNNLIVDTPTELKYILPKPNRGERRRHIFKNSNGIITRDWLHDSTLNINKNNLYHPVKDLSLHELWRKNITRDIYVINLKERTDRFKKIENKFKNFNLIRVDAVKDVDGAIGCFKSHQKCIKIAQEKALKNIIVIEDDCCPLDNFEERLENIMNYLNSNTEWSIYLGGTFKTCTYNIINKESVGEEILCSVDYGFCMHFVIYSNLVYDKFIQANPEECPIDHWWPMHMNALISIPFLATQSDNVSNISGRRDDIIRKRIKRTNHLLLQSLK